MAWSVFSSESVSPSELDGLMRQFGANPTVLPMGDQPEPGSWSVPITDGELVISEATADLRAMPPAMIESATRLLGTTPRYCLSIFAAVGRATGSISAEKDDSETAQLVQRIVNAFAGRWPAVLSDNTTNPMTTLGALATGQTRQPSQQGQKRGWRRFFGG
jgi:hypothetical protein